MKDALMNIKLAIRPVWVYLSTEVHLRMGDCLRVRAAGVLSDVHL